MPSGNDDNKPPGLELQVNVAGPNQVELRFGLKESPHVLKLDARRAETLGLALIKGATVHMGSAVENSVFQLLRIDSIGSGTWTLSIGAIQGAPPGLTRVHYFLYYELPDISCNLFGN